MKGLNGKKGLRKKQNVNTALTRKKPLLLAEASYILNNY